jgi:hypothetical protein
LLNTQWVIEEIKRKSKDSWKLMKMKTPLSRPARTCPRSLNWRAAGDVRKTTESRQNMHKAGSR